MGLRTEFLRQSLPSPAVKGIELAMVFKLSELKGSEARDEYVASDGKIALTSNHNGGILGGISTGEAVNFRVCIKPTPSISISSKSIAIAGARMWSLRLAEDMILALHFVQCLVLRQQLQLRFWDLMLGDINFSGRFVFND